MLPVPGEVRAQQPFCPTPACSGGGGNGILTVQVRKLRDLVGRKSLLKPAVGTISAAGEFRPQQEEIASASPPSIFPLYSKHLLKPQ